MGEELVSSSPNEDGGENRPSSFSVGEIFRTMCPVYLEYGMPYELYWDGEASAARYYREAYLRKLDTQNKQSHLVGAYVYQALCCVAPAFNPLAKDHSPAPYPSEVIPITEQEADEQEVRRKERLMKQSIEAIRTQVTNVNSRFKKSEKGGENGTA